MKTWKPVLVASILTIALAGCTSKSTSNAPDKNTQTNATANTVFSPQDYYKMDDDKTVVELNGQKLTVGEIKKQAFNQIFLSEVNHFIEMELLLQKYPVSDKEVNKEFKKYQSNPNITKDQVRYQIAYDKAIHDGVDITEETLKSIYHKNFENSGRSYEDMKSQLKQMAPYYMGINVNDKIVGLRKKASITYMDDKLKTQVNSLFSNSTKQQENRTE